MKKTFFARLVLLNTFKKRLRALLVIGGIAISSSVMIVLFGVSSGLENLVTTEIHNSEAKDVVTVDQRNVQQIRLDQEKISDVQSISGVGQVESSVGLLGNLVYDNVDLSIPVYGVSKDYFSVSPSTFRAGEGLGLQGSNVVVSTKVLEAFGLGAGDAVGRQLQASVTISKEHSSGQVDETVTTRPEMFNIVAVVDKGDLPVAYVPLEGLRSSGVDIVSQLKVRLSTPDRMPEVRESIEQMGFQTSSIQDSVDQINKVFTVIQKTLLIFGLIVFAITVSGTFTIISLTLMEEMRQIGFLRISGLRNADVKTLFIVQSMLLTTMGAVFGVIGGVIGGGIVNGLAAAAAADEVFSGQVTVFAVPTPQIVMVLVMSLAIGWLVGIFPARRAVLIRPLDEMKL